MIALASPAKINLFLRIVRRRSDGYHELASLFQTISLCDRLTMRLSERDQLICNMPQLPTDRSNLIWKAVDLYRKKTGFQSPLSITLDKRIPVEAGLGGGSSNAATALWAINSLSGSMMPAHDLQQIAAQIGSDVPFFFSSGSAYCTGRGEIVQSLAPLPPQKLWIVKPSQGLSTPAVYRNLQVDLLPKRNPEECLQEFLNGNPCYFNDLETSACQLRPELFELKETLGKMGFEHLLLAGSGSSFVCLGDPKEMPASWPGVFQEPASYISREQHSWFPCK